ncbi:hypothetical protein BGZ83_002226, partial [Gryganskiella cystojenkinii]
MRHPVCFDRSTANSNLAAAAPGFGNVSDSTLVNYAQFAQPAKAVDSDVQQLRRRSRILNTLVLELLA